MRELAEFMHQSECPKTSSFVCLPYLPYLSDIHFTNTLHLSDRQICMRCSDHMDSM